ncbi:uncharacterized protein LOC125522841 isoform X5 [Triticum urartu]|uniref:uncharacterized protein LOC125522841 isoform X5 n=1 Tax=Triticum urartu TaxID=4572 RepID=UPI0020435A87|nr:uncharacterized protein LOC125522841 isoform X5 [Triticum urartu]
MGTGMAADADADASAGPRSMYRRRHRSRADPSLPHGAHALSKLWPTPTPTPIRTTALLDADDFGRDSDRGQKLDRPPWLGSIGAQCQVCTLPSK